MSDIKYWNSYYQSHMELTQKSSFAEFVANRYELSNKSILELGCGNGRDSYFFYKNHNAIVTAIEQSESIVKFLNDNYANKHFKIIEDDFTSLKFIDTYDVIYSRFTLHSITEDQENKVLDFVKTHLNKNGIFALEARSTKDPMLTKGSKISSNENITDHYRRYLDYEIFKNKLTKLGFIIDFSIEDKDLAIYKDDNPYVIRIIAKIH